MDRRGVPVGEASCRIGILGRLDLEDYGHTLGARVVRRELLDRIPGASVRLFAPLGYLRPTTFDGGLPADPLLPVPSDGGPEDLDCAVLGCGDDLPLDPTGLAADYGAALDDPGGLARVLVEGPGGEPGPAVAWTSAGLPASVDAPLAERLAAASSRLAVSGVRDRAGAEALRRAGVASAPEVVPHPAILLARLVPPAVLRKRLDYLRTMGWAPPDGGWVVVQGDRPLVGEAPGIMARLRAAAGQRAIVAAECGRRYGDGEFAGALAAAWEAGAFRLPPVADAADLCSIVWGSDLVVTGSLLLAAAALAFARPVLLLGLGDRPALESWVADVPEAGALVRTAEEIPAVLAGLGERFRPSEALGRLRPLLDAHLDIVAEVAEKAAARRPLAGPRPALEAEAQDLRWRLRALREAYEVAVGGLARERLAVADALAPLHAEAAALRRRVEQLEGDLARATTEGTAVRTELEALLRTRTLRYTAHLRRLYSAMRRWAE